MEEKQDDGVEQNLKAFIGTASGPVLLKHPIGSDIILAEIKFLKIFYIAINYNVFSNLSFI